MPNSREYCYEVSESGRGEFHTYDVIRKKQYSNGHVVGSYRWRFVAEQVAAFLSDADDRDEFIEQTSKDSVVADVERDASDTSDRYFDK